MPEWVSDLSTSVAICLIFLWFMWKMLGTFAGMQERIIARHEEEIKAIGKACHRHTDELARRYEKLAEENMTTIRTYAAQGGELLTYIRRLNGGKTSSSGG